MTHTPGYSPACILRNVLSSPVLHSTCTADKGSIPGPNPSHHVNKVDAAAQRWPYRDRSPI